ncbi:MAG: ATP-binding protein [Actinomycetota bacterium]|nr:ATP-binding protein [Actinomycetota bacterium]
MARRLVPGGLRTQLALAIALVTTLGVGASFLALYSGLGTRLVSQIDADLRTQLAEFNQFRTRTGVATPAEFERTARAFLSSQRYHAESLIYVVQVNGAPTVTNDPELVSREHRREQNGPATGLLIAPTGTTTASVAEAGDVRVLTQPVEDAHRIVGTIRIADPLRSVKRTQSGLLRTFAFVGTLTLLLSIAAGVALATLLAAPVRRMADAAVAVDAGDLSARAGPVHARGELRALAVAFDAMLGRLERVFKRQRDFVSDASHELRTPLTVLRAQIELLDHETDPEVRHQATTLMLRRLDELDRLVGDMLTLASAEAGQLVVPETIDLNDYFEDLRRDLPLFGERDFVLEAVAGTLDADPDRLTQVLRNLVRNAVAHTSPGDPIKIIAVPRQNRLEISVTDTGPGIPADELEEIFTRFHRLDGSRSRDSGGSGLGLAIARALVEAHGGRLHAESSPGSGATFRLDLPGYRAPQQAPASV